MKWYIVDIDSLVKITPTENLEMLFIGDDDIYTTDLNHARMFSLKREAVAWIKENLMGDKESFYFYLPMKESDVLLRKMGVI